MANTRYTAKDHERAFKMWRQGKSFREISEEQGMPSRETLRRWSQEGYDCPFDCEWHAWKQKHSDIVSEALEDIEEDMPDLVERERKRLKFLFQVEEQITEIMESGELDPPRTLKDAVDLLSEVYNQQRLIKGESTEITEMRGADHNELNLQKVMQQLNVGDVSEDEFVEAVEDSIMEGESNGENGS